jgi:hypothetical protein
VSSSGASGITPVSDTSPWEGRFPKRPWTSDGPRIEPPVSDPSARSSHGYEPILAPYSFRIISDMDSDLRLRFNEIVKLELQNL